MRRDPSSRSQVAEPPRKTEQDPYIVMLCSSAS